MSEWRDMLRDVATRQRLADGMRVTFNGSVSIGRLAELVAAEQDCCRFFDFAITCDQRGVALEVRAPLDAQSIVIELFGVAA